MRALGVWHLMNDYLKFEGAKCTRLYTTRIKWISNLSTYTRLIAGARGSMRGFKQSHIYIRFVLINNFQLLLLSFPLSHELIDAEESSWYHIRISRFSLASKAMLEVISDPVQSTRGLMVITTSEWLRRFLVGHLPFWGLYNPGN